MKSLSSSTNLIIKRHSFQRYRRIFSYSTGPRKKLQGKNLGKTFCVLLKHDVVDIEISRTPVIQIIDSHIITTISYLSFFNQAPGDGLLLANQKTEFAESYSLLRTAI